MKKKDLTEERGSVDTATTKRFSILRGMDKREVAWLSIRLDLIGRVPEELRTEVPDIVQEVVIKTIPKKKKCKKVKWLSEEALQTAMKRREAKGKGEKERYTHVNAEFQRRARRDKKAFISDQCKEIEENNGKDQRSLQEN